MPGRLAELLQERGDVEALRAMADDNRAGARSRLTDLLAHWGDEEGLRALADNQDYPAQEELAKLLGKRYAVPELKHLFHATYAGAAEELIKLYRRDQPDGSQLELDVNAEPRPSTAVAAAVVRDDQQFPGQKVARGGGEAAKGPAARGG
jgi:hypothetical protein